MGFRRITCFWTHKWRVGTERFCRTTSATSQ